MKEYKTLKNIINIFNTQVLKKISKINKNTYIGSMKSVNDKFLKKYNINTIITFLKPKYDMNLIYKYNINHKIFYVRDNIDDSDLLMENLDSITNLINNCNINDKNVLIHCLAGNVRSPVCVCAWLIKYKKMFLNEAIDFLIEKKPECFIIKDCNFIDVLKKYEKNINKSFTYI